MTNLIDLGLLKITKENNQILSIFYKNSLKRTGGDDQKLTIFSYNLRGNYILSILSYNKVEANRYFMYSAML